MTLLSFYNSWFSATLSSIKYLGAESITIFKIFPTAKTKEEKHLLILGNFFPQANSLQKKKKNPQQHNFQRDFSPEEKKSLIGINLP